MVLGTYLMGMPQNDSIHVPHEFGGVMAETLELDVPDGETWTLERLSEQFYAPHQGCNPQGAMWHLTVTTGGFEINAITRTIRTQECQPMDYWEYRNESCQLPIVGPAHVRVYGYNHTGEAIVFYLAGVWTRRATDA